MPSLSAARVIRDCFKILAPSILRQKDSFYVVHYRVSADGKARSIAEVASQPRRGGETAYDEKVQ